MDKGLKEELTNLITSCVCEYQKKRDEIEDEVWMDGKQMQKTFPMFSTGYLKKANKGLVKMPARERIGGKFYYPMHKLNRQLHEGYYRN